MLDNRRKRSSADGMFPVPVAGIAGGLGAIWLGGVAVAAGSALPLWAPVAAIAVAGGAAGAGWVLTKLSHGGDWGRDASTRRGSHRPGEWRDRREARAHGNRPYRRMVDRQGATSDRVEARFEEASWR